MPSKAATVAQSLAGLPPARRHAIAAVREVILANLDKDYEEGMTYGMTGDFVPHRVYPPGWVLSRNLAGVERHHGPAAASGCIGGIGAACFALLAPGP